MQLDVPTLMVAGAFVASFSAALLLFAWYQYRETNAALWWAGADASLACALVLMVIGATGSNIWPFDISMVLMILASTFAWGGARSFDTRRAGLAGLVGGTLIWIAATTFIPGFTFSLLAPVLHTIITLAYYGAGAISISTGKGEALRARFPMAALMTIHAFTLMLAVPAAFTQSLKPNQVPPIMSWFGAIHFETLVFVIGTALFLVAMMKERGELRYADASLTDALTGLLNRRGFFSKAERILERSRREGAPAVVAVLDLDRFKSINDRFGHAMGDRVLQVFAEACNASLRPIDVVGRIGGEEFAVVLPGVATQAGYAMAERLRRNFAEAARQVGGEAVEATLCAGIAADTGAGDIHEVLRRADRALYCAKSTGRNRVVVDGDEPPETVVRIA